MDDLDTKPGQDDPAPVSDDFVQSTTGDAPESKSLSAELRGVIDDLQNLVETELDFHKARISYSVSEMKRVSVLMVGVGVFGSTAVMALIVGLLFALVPLVGRWGALAIVTGFCVAMALICFFLARSKTRKMQSLFKTDNNSGEE